MDETTVEQTKRCIKCSNAKGPDGFYFDKSKSGGFSSFCRPCTLEQRRTYREANRETLKLQARVDRKRFPLRVIWYHMVQRCTDPADHKYKSYGGRGIRVCDRWLNSYEAFCDDMGTRPSLQHSIDRIDNDRSYEPSNCRWATPVEQGRNRRDNRMITVDNVTRCLAEWAELSGIRQRLISARIDKLKWDPRRAVSEPADPRFGQRRTS